jgi:hypothetical protein
VSNRAIDRHEDAICAVLDITHYQQAPYAVALAHVAPQHDLTVERLDQLVRCWCGIAGIEVPS